MEIVIPQAFGPKLPAFFCSRQLHMETSGVDWQGFHTVLRGLAPFAPFAPFTRVRFPDIAENASMQREKRFELSS
jgi:hypothetical protein